jgi:hypothetical protein
MKHKLGILSALVLSLAIAGSAFAAPQTPTMQKKSTSVSMKGNKLVASKKQKKHHKKSKKSKTSSKTKTAANTTSNPK